MLFIPEMNSRFLLCCRRSCFIALSVEPVVTKSSKMMMLCSAGRDPSENVALIRCLEWQKATSS